MRNWSSEVDPFLRQIDGPREKTRFASPSKIKSPGWKLHSDSEPILFFRGGCWWLVA